MGQKYRAQFIGTYIIIFLLPEKNVTTAIIVI